MTLETLRQLSQDCANALEIGKAAEHLVCADLILQGYRCYLTDQGLPYDLVVDIDGRLIRIQVKAACFPANLNCKGRTVRMGYNFNVRRRGKHGDKRLTERDCDIVALSALDIRKTAYLPIVEVPSTCQMMLPNHDFYKPHPRCRTKHSVLGFPNRIRHNAIDGFPFSEAVSRCPV